MIGVFRGCRIAANAVAAVVIVLLLVDPQPRQRRITKCHSPNLSGTR
jgi:hypothetical protein